jgi:asparagine synthase (glutamine-hydrolysing)
MCGLAGAIAVAPDARVDRERLGRMAALMGHRGPDAVGSWSDPAGRAALVHRRLSIIDVAGGSQPMCNDSGDVVLVLNGEIYNYREERQLLRDAGITFRTNSDTEVLLRLYERYGAECVHRLRGMFAFAVWDANRGELLVARDRVGKKPLFYALENGCFYFASTLNALHDTSQAPPRMNLEALDAFLGLGYIPAPLSIWENISKLPAATLLSVSQQGLRAARYWHLGAEREQFGGGFDDAVDHLDELLNTAVSLRLRSDVPLGVFLSGGIDSSLVAAIAKRQSASSTLTFSIGFEDPAFDESIFAERIAAHLGTEHRTFHGRPEMMHVLPELVHHFGEPFGDSSALATFLLAREARAHVTVALTGDGGDEGFGGYDWYRNALRLKRLRQVIPAPVAWAGALASRAFDRDSRMVQRARRGLRVLAMGEAQRFGALRTFINRDEMHLLYAGELRRARAHGGFAADDWIAVRYDEGSGTALRRMRLADVATYLADGLMPKVDVTTMAHGLEARAPLLDQEILQFAMGLRDEWLLDGNGGKGILKALLRRYVPTSLFERPKQGFTVPLKRWFAGTGRTDVLDDLHHAEPLLDTGWFQSRGIQQLVGEHRSGLRDHTQRLYDLVVLREWLRQR